jgi:hypothetical protein
VEPLPSETSAQKCGLNFFYRVIGVWREQKGNTYSESVASRFTRRLIDEFVDDIYHDQTPKGQNYYQQKGSKHSISNLLCNQVQVSLGRMSDR